MGDNNENNTWEKGADTTNNQWSGDYTEGPVNSGDNNMRGGNEFRQDADQYVRAPEEGYYVPEEPNPGMAVAGMICGILSIVCCCTWYIRLPLAVVGIILSSMALAQDKPGKGMAATGLFCSVVGIVISVYMIIFMFIVKSAATSLPDYLKQLEDFSGRFYS